MSITLLLDSSGQPKTDDFTIKYQNPIVLAGNWELALVSANLWYSWYSISASIGNNIFRYYNGSIWQDIIIPDGNYTIIDINSTIQAGMLANGDFTAGPSGNQFDITLEANYSTIRVKITLTGGYEIDFSAGRLYELLGADPVIVTISGDLPNVANINNDVNKILIHCSLLQSSSVYTNAAADDVIWSAVPKSVPGTNIDIEPAQRVYVPISTRDGSVRSVRMYITDNLGRRLDLNGEPTTYSLHLRKMRIMDY